MRVHYGTQYGTTLILYPNPMQSCKLFFKKLKLPSL